MYTAIILNLLKDKLVESRYDRILVDQLITYLKQFSCRNPNPLYINEQLLQKICLFSRTNDILPINKISMDLMGDRWVNGHPLYREGENGSILEGEFNGEHILTKTSKQFTPGIIREIFINMLIVNEVLLMNPLLENNLVPTYGLFSCKQNDSEDVCKIELSVDPYEPYYINMIQQRVLDGISFGSYLNNPATTCEMMFHTLHTMFTTLDQLYKTPFRLRHNDLHGKNIIMKRVGGNYVPVIIDYGLSSFYTNLRLIRDIDDNTREMEYETLVPFMNHPIIGSAIDIWWVLHSMYWCTNEPIRQYAKRLRNRFFWDRSVYLNDYFYEGKIFPYGDPVENRKAPIHHIPWFYYMMIAVEEEMKSYLSYPEFIFEHGKHVQLINQMTYEFILFEIINDHEDHVAMFGKKRKSKKRKSNRRRRSR